MRTSPTLFVIALPCVSYAQSQAPATPTGTPPAAAAESPARAGASAGPAPVVDPQTAPATAVETEPSSTEPKRLGLLAGAKLGGIVPFDGLSPFPQVGIEVGYVLPPIERQLAIVVAIDYTRPTTANVESDPRVMGGTYTWKLTEQELGVMANVIFRATSVRPAIPYGGIGPRILFARSDVRDDGAPRISMTNEHSMRIGVGIPLGVELPLGPGHATGELLLQYGTLDHVATGDAHTGALTLALGYRMIL